MICNSRMFRLYQMYDHRQRIHTGFVNYDVHEYKTQKNNCDDETKTTYSLSLYSTHIKYRYTNKKDLSNDYIIRHEKEKEKIYFARNGNFY